MMYSIMDAWGDVLDIQSEAEKRQKEVFRKWHIDSRQLPRKKKKAMRKLLFLEYCINDYAINDLFKF